MLLTAWAMLAVLGVYFWTGVMAGYARVKYKVPAPSMDGPAAFQSAQRVHINTLEQLPIVIVPLWLCATYLGDVWAAAGGLLWCGARIAYALGYYRDPAQRELGFVLGMVASALLIGGTVVGLLMQ
ncbi:MULTISPECIES: MAPEG family protein [unclassified Massilia]|uniref:MAPEG family protein n=1 Tax=unclassified Massilia TaxID=2609279 RepID=UPI00177D2091|nr:MULTISPECIES: MAPEG family protein [unclassified Massilia]MBD8531407.1 MAPEG family protein [Massilia sp. CFBP 13647]MBD8674339.1 MAPEG family protein [Massilia sp. CFBP 13721]